MVALSELVDLWVWICSKYPGKYKDVGARVPRDYTLCGPVVQSRYQWRSQGEPLM